jgi:hypothetical protein
MEYAARTVLVPAAGYVNERGETTGYVRKTELDDPNRQEPLALVTLRGTVVGTFDENRPPAAEVNRIAAEEAAE